MRATSAGVSIRTRSRTGYGRKEPGLNSSCPIRCLLIGSVAEWPHRQSRDWNHIQALMREVVDHGDASWHALLTALDPQLISFAKRQPIGRLRELEDTPREIVTRVLARLHANHYAALRKMLAEDPPPHPRAWLRVLVRRAAIDYMRAQPEFVRGSQKEDPALDHAGQPVDRRRCRRPGHPGGQASRGYFIRFRGRGPRARALPRSRRSRVRSPGVGVEGPRAFMSAAWSRRANSSPRCSPACWRAYRTIRRRSAFR